MTAPPRLDAIYVTASARDARYTRICVASIKHFYPDAPVKLLIGGPLEEGLQEEMERYWNVGVADVPRRDWGWGFVKLEPLFGAAGERFMVLDSDTAFGGKVLATWADSTADFLVDDEQQSEDETRRLYYDWRKLARVDPAARAPGFVFNSGQWFGTAGILTREDFAPLVDWSGAKPTLKHADLFMPGDQGVLNYVLNQKSDVVAVDRQKIMRWPGHGMEGFTAATVAAKTAPPLVIHWAGMKKPRLGAMAGSDVLRFFEAFYYSQLPAGRLQAAAARVKYPLAEWRHDLGKRIRARL